MKVDSVRDVISHRYLDTHVFLYAYRYPLQRDKYRLKSTLLIYSLALKRGGGCRQKL